MPTSDKNEHQNAGWEINNGVLSLYGLNSKEELYEVLKIPIWDPQTGRMYYDNTPIIDK